MYMLFKVKEHKCLGIMEKVQNIGFLNKYWWGGVETTKNEMENIYITNRFIEISAIQNGKCHHCTFPCNYLID